MVTSTAMMRGVSVVTAASLILAFTVISLRGAEVSDDDLQKISEDILSSEVNGAGPWIVLELQSRAPNDGGDAAPGPLLKVNSEALALPTVRKLMPLLDNYEARSEIAETVTSEEKKEEDDFIQAILSTPPIQTAHRFLVSKGLAPSDRERFSELLRQIWLELYPRSNKIKQPGSSGLEHVFLAETRGDSVQGLHSWLYFYLMEKKGVVNYEGYLRHLPLGVSRSQKMKLSLVKVRFRWAGTVKPSSSLFVGSSPELEIALYTVCFLTRPDSSCRLRLAGKSVRLQTWSNQYQGRKHLASAYPLM